MDSNTDSDLDSNADSDSDSDSDIDIDIIHILNSLSDYGHIILVTRPKNHTYVDGKPQNETSFGTNIYPHWRGAEYSQTERFQISKHI